MLKKLYVFDVDIFLDIGGAGKASFNIIRGLSYYYGIIFIPKYAVYKKINDCNKRSLFIKHMNDLKDLGISVPNILVNLSHETEIKYNKYLAIISNVIEEGSMIMDLNYFPELEADSASSIIKSFFYSGEIVFIRNTKKCKVIALLQTLDNRPIKSHLYFALKSFSVCNFFSLKLLLKSFYRNIKDSISAKHLVNNADLILIYSKGSIISLGQFKNSTKFRVLTIGNTIDKRIPLKPRIKSNYLIFYSRLIYDKGLFDLLEIFKVILKTKDTRLVITGKFPNQQLENEFFNKAKTYKISDKIEYGGFVDANELKKLIAEAKVFLYPSHYDSFPYAILEAVSSFTAVVTYSIPSILYSYQSLRCVYKINEFDINKMAKKTIEVLNLSDDDYFNLFSDEKIKEFINEHTDNNESIKEIYKFIS